MEKCAPEKLAEWLFEKLLESEVSEYLPRENMHMICERAMFFFYQEGVLKSEGLMDWLEAEYSVPRGVLIEVLVSLKAEASENLCVRILLPGDDEGPAGEDEEDHEAGDDVDTVPLSDIRKEEPEADAESGVPGDDDASIEPGPAAPPPGPAKAARPPARSKSVSAIRKPWQMMPPQAKDPQRNLSAFLHDTTYLDWVILDVAHDGYGPANAIIKKVMEREFSFSADEKEVLCNSDLEPGSKLDSVPAWILRMNAYALAYGYALELVNGCHDFDASDWNRGVRQLGSTFSDLVVRLLSKRSDAGKQGGPLLAAFESSYSRLKNLHDEVDEAAKTVSAKPAGETGAAASPAGRRPAARTGSSSAKPAAAAEGGLQGFINRYPALVIVFALLVIAVSVAYGLHLAGIFKGSDIKTLSIELPAVGIDISSVTAQGPSMVVVVAGNQWKSLDTSGKERLLQKLYVAANTNGLTQLQVRSSDDELLAQLWSEDSFRIFK